MQKKREDYGAMLEEKSLKSVGSSASEKSRREESSGTVSAERGFFAARLRVLAPEDSQVVRS